MQRYVIRMLKQASSWLASGKSFSWSYARLASTVVIRSHAMAWIDTTIAIHISQWAWIFAQPPTSLCPNLRFL